MKKKKIKQTTYLSICSDYWFKQINEALKSQHFKITPPEKIKDPSEITKRIKGFRYRLLNSGETVNYNKYHNLIKEL